MIPNMKILKKVIILIAVFVLGFYSYEFYTKYAGRSAVLKKIITRLEADTRVAEVLVTGVNFDEESGKNTTTIKFLEYDVEGQPLKPKYFTFSGNIIQFQSLVIRFDNDLVRRGDSLRGKSIYLFWKVFMLNGSDTEEYVITELGKVPGGYKVQNEASPYENEIWNKFWRYALNKKEREELGVKSAQIEAPGTIFVPGVVYTIHIEHDGGIRIDTEEVSPIFQGEAIPEAFKEGDK